MYSFEDFKYIVSSEDFTDTNVEVLFWQIVDRIPEKFPEAILFLNGSRPALAKKVGEVYHKKMVRQRKNRA